MTPRSYRLGKRAARVAGSRARMVAAARQLIAEGGFHHTAVEEVARRADVARATVYNQFGSKLGLLHAVIDDIEARAELGRIAAAIDTPDAAEALRRTFEEGCRYWAVEHALARKVIGLGAVDPEVQEVLLIRDDQRNILVTRLVERLAEQRKLNADYPPERAVDVLWLLSSFETFDKLFTGRDLPIEEVSALLINLAGCVVDLHQYGEPDRDTERKNK